MLFNFQPWTEAIA